MASQASKSSSSSSITTKHKLKLLVDTDTAKVLYAEVGKDFVDFLFSLLTLQVSSVVRVLSKDHMVGCLGELYSSLESFSSWHWLPNIDKAQILRPTPALATPQKTLITLRYDGLPAGAGTGATGATGFVKGGEAVYMVTDDLVVTPLEMSGIVEVMRNVSDGRLLQEKSVELGMEEGLKLVRASLCSRTVLTDVFLGKGSGHGKGCEYGKLRPISPAF